MMYLSERPRFRRLSALALAYSIATVSTASIASTASAQTSAVTGSPGAPKELHIVIIEGEDALNNIRQRTAREPIVKVEDENHKPVAGVLILFAAHGSGSGAGATFAGATSLSVQTDPLGQAVATGFHPNLINGKYQIDVTASLGSITASAIINEQNVTEQASDENSLEAPPPVAPVKRHLAKKIWIISGAVAVGIVLAVVLTRSSGATITAGTGGVGHP